MGTPRSHRIKRLIGGQDVRLAAADHGFLKDLAKVGLMSVNDAEATHYAGRKSGAVPRLDRLCEVGLLDKRVVRAPTGERMIAYSFANMDIARAWGGHVPNIGARRNAYHELLVGRLYFSLGRPDDYRVAARFTRSDVAVFGAALSTRPDAVYTDTTTGEVVAVEADSGHYTARQVAFKQRAWRGLRQVWGQPRNAFHKMPSSPAVAVFRY